MIRDTIKWLLFPGINLHARLRYRVLPQFLPVPKDPDASVLDAGCGNGMLTYQAYRKGYRAVGISIKADEIARNKRLFNNHLGIPEARLSFMEFNLYNLDKLGMQFDHVICSEVLEHIRDDERVCRSFFQVLKEGGVLHLCCPNADHPDNRNHVLDPHEKGGHVRPGYTMQSYRELLEPIGFVLQEPIGLGGAIRQSLNKTIRACESFLGLPGGVACFLLVSPLLLLESKRNTVPYSLYVRAVKPKPE